MKKSTTVLSFLKRNAVYFVLALCVLALGIATTIVLVNRSKLSSELENPPQLEIPDTPADNQDPLPDVPVDDITPTPTPTPDTQPVIEPITFAMPVANATSIGEYADTMVFNSTLNRFSAHLAIDFFAPEGTDVLAVYGGTVKSVENSLLTGVNVIIDHGDGLETVYNSLADGDSVSVGMKVNKGDVIGQVSTTNRQEYKAGAHLHFEVKENGELIDPAKYLVFQEK